ncbi:MAG: polyphosphate kinase 1 [Phycisphaeraceae bacterium]|nr:polyphosphate kinase 1 [Phycisphaeraceae bacterium]
MTFGFTNTNDHQHAAAPLAPGEEYFNRDTSWLEFNRRVLAQATDTSQPLLERVKFLAIFASNLDEFFMKRVGLLIQLDAARVEKHGLDNRRPDQVLREIRRMVEQMQRELASCWKNDLKPSLVEYGIAIEKYENLSKEEKKRLDDWFNSEVFPILTPLAVDPGHRFPFISNMSESLGILLQAPGSTEKQFARLKVPDVLPRLVRIEGQHGQRPGQETFRFVMIEQVIQNNLDDVFPGMTICDVMPFRVTRNAAVELEEEGEDIIESVETELNLRRFAQVVRLETPANASSEMVELLQDELSLQDRDVYSRPGPLEYGDLFEIADLPLPDLKYEPYRAVVPKRIGDEDNDVFAAIRKGNILVHHPYESFGASVERMITQAARDPDVLAIKQTLYRTSPDSPFIQALIRAAEQGKQVACLVEVRARFDESRNVRFARQLEKHGVHVAYGVVGLKTHCKCAMVVRREGGQLRTYAHVGTGNYNSRTSTLYTDLGLLTCDPEITQDVSHLFNLLTGRSMKRDYNRLLVAPYAMRDKFLSLIDAEIEHAKAGRRARIVAKMNALEDSLIMERLYQASSAGVKIDLFVRGFCCLRPGVKGLSENIRVRSIVGRYLEHSRIYHFSAGQTDPAMGVWYIASADWMYRNLSNRVEAAVPVRKERLCARLNRIIDVLDRDRACAWELNPDGSYTKLTPDPNATDGDTARMGTFNALMADARITGAM